MAPHGDVVSSSSSYSNKRAAKNLATPPKLSGESLYRTISDISFELSNIDEDVLGGANANANASALPPISEVENAKCQCCGMSEECTPEYIAKVRASYSGKWICGLCSEAVKEEMDKDKGKTTEDALEAHITHCMSFNKVARAYPVLLQARAMRDILKKSGSRSRDRASSVSPKDTKGPTRQGIARSSSCMPALAREIKWPN